MHRIDADKLISFLVSVNCLTTALQSLAPTRDDAVSLAGQSVRLQLWFLFQRLSAYISPSPRPDITKTQHYSPRDQGFQMLPVLRNEVEEILLFNSLKLHCNL
jgi:hypothetical protein